MEPSVSSDSDVASEDTRNGDFMSAKSVASKETFYTAASLGGFGPRSSVPRLQELVEYSPDIHTLTCIGTASMQSF
jgi:hypothetical protein